MDIDRHGNKIAISISCPDHGPAPRSERRQPAEADRPREHPAPAQQRGPPPRLVCAQAEKAAALIAENLHRPDLTVQERRAHRGVGASDRTKGASCAD
jgi:hypothetical protein